MALSDFISSSLFGSGGRMGKDNPILSSSPYTRLESV